MLRQELTLCSPKIKKYILLQVQTHVRTAFTKAFAMVPLPC